MEATTVSTFTELLVNVLLGCFSLMCVSMLITSIQNIVNEHRDEKRKQKKEVQDDEYHRERMKNLK